MKNFRKVLSVVLPFTLIFAFFAPMNFAQAASSSFAITGNPVSVVATATGFQVSLSGTATVTNPKGDNYGVSVIWGAGTTCVPATYSFATSGNTVTTPWSASKVFTTAGTYTITALVHHSQCAGAESADATITFTATIPPEICLDGIDNDFDGQTDLSDSDCLPYFPNITVNKVVVNDNGGTKQPADFSLFVDSTPVTSGQTIAVMPGVHTVSETADPEYAKTGITGSCASNGTFTAVAGLNQNYTCTITNNDIQNLPPVFTSVPTAVTTPELVAYTFTATATDPESNPLTFSLSGAPAGASITSAGVFTWTPTEAQGPGSYPFTVRVSDNHGNNTDSVITITVSEVNIAPTASSKSISTTEDTFGTATLSGTDSDLPAQTLSFNVTQPAHGTVTLSGDIATYTPNANFNGSDSFTYTVSDGVTTSTPATVTVTVSSINDAPSLAPISDATIPELSLFTFTASAIDIDNSAIVYSITSGATGGAINSSTGVFTWTPTEAQGPGSYPFTIEVSDGTSTDSKSFTVNVTEVNQAPVLSSIGNKSISETSTLSFTISGSDADVPSNTLTFGANDLPNGATFDADTKTFSWTPTFEQSGNYQVTFTLSDGFETDSEIVPIDVGNVNRTPVLDTVGDKTVDEGNALSFSISGSDPDAGDLSFSASNLPAGATFDADTKTFSWTPGFEESGTYSVTFKVTDGNLEDEETVVITVNNVNRAPVSVDQSLSIDEDTTIDITITASDVDLPAQTLAYAITNTSNGTLSNVDLDAGTMTYTPNANFNGTDSFTFTSNDGSLTSNVATVSISIASINDDPTISLNGSDSIAITEGSVYTEAGAVCSDVEDGSPVVSITGSVDANTVGHYVLTYNCKDASDVTVTVTRTVDVQAKPAQCMDGIDNDQDGKTDFEGGDPGCSNGTDNNETDPVIPQCADGKDNDGDGSIDMNDSGCSNSEDNDETNPVVRTSGGGSGYIPKVAQAPAVGQVLGASTSCGIYVDKFLRRGYKNDAEAVKKLQKFLNDYMKAGIKEDGKFGAGTEKWVKKFQLTNKGSVLSPWKLKAPTGIFYITTQTEVNKIMCPELNLTTPTLIPIEKNPLAPKKN